MPSVQTKLAKYFTRSINKDFGVDISIDEVAITVFGGVKFKNVLILDHHKDTLIFSNRVKTNLLGGKKILDGDLIFGDLRLDGLIFNLKTYKNEKKSNLDKFIAAFETGKPPSEGHFLLQAKKVYLTNGRFLLMDENRVNPKDIDFTRINSIMEDFKLYGPEVNADIQRMSFLDHRGLFVENLSSKFSYTKKHIKLENLDLLTKESKLKGNVVLNYKIEDFSNFTDKVDFDVKLESSTLASNDIRYFYNELGKNLHFKIKANIKGPLNDLRITRLKLSDSKKTQIIGYIHFKNLLGNKEQKFSMNGKFKKLTSSYGNLVAILPNVLGKKLPIVLKKLGNFTLVGNTKITTTSLDAYFKIATSLGKAQANLRMNNMDFIDQASYEGNIVLENFDVGSLLDNKEVGKVSTNIDVDGVGFSEKYLNTSIKGKVSYINYNNYTYKDIVLNGNFKMPHYKGHISVNDPNLKMKFDGLVDLSKKASRYDFNINVENADLKKLNLVSDSISSFKGDVVVQVNGNTLENLQGNIYINSATYQNTKAIYSFDDFNINSSFDENRIRTITVNSPDIAEGEIVGKFEFRELKNLLTNSLGSLYTNYKPLKVKKGQFLKFDFAIYNKIIEIFYPDIVIGSNTIVKGNINSDKQEFKFNFNSPKIIAYNDTLDNIRISIDNKNPLYNAFIEIDSIKTKQYKVRDFSLINVTMKDTLYFRTEFKGGSKGEDYFNLNLYHTIDKDNNNVVGISKSEIKLKDYLWFLNEKDLPNNKIVFDKALKNFSIDDIILSHGDQNISFKGEIKGKKFKDLELSFKDVDLSKFTAAEKKLSVQGNLNGKIDFKQNDAVFQPASTISIDNLNVNNVALGQLSLNIEGDENLQKFTINSVLENENMESFNVDGSFEIIEKETILDLNLKFNKFNLGTLSSLGGDVISDIRGLVSGNASIAGKLKNPEINGRLYVDEGGLGIPYLNVDYALGDKTIIDLTDDQFLFRNNTLTDTKYKTNGTLNGSIQHHNFSDWKLDLAITTKRLLALDTKDSEDAAYFGTAFINGKATIKGPTNGLFIKVDAKSEKGTAVKIPINNAESVSENNFIHFVTVKEKYNSKYGIVEKTRNYNGLELEFDFEITPNAEVEVILDRLSGHGMKARGNGTLLFKINTLGRFNMWGDFLPFDGTYNFKYKGLIDKKFNIKKGGSIIWEGNPLRAQLNLEAVYKTSANPALLLENSAFSKKVPVEVIVGIRGDLASPEPDFNIEFPTVSNVMKSEIEYALEDKDVRQTQALYLLSTGGFLSSDGVSESDFSSSLFETASGLLGDIVKSDDEKFEMNFNVVTADKRAGKESDGRFEAVITSKVNERITINGKVGVPFGGINESAIVGDIDVKYRVNDDGSFNLHMFNKENDVVYIGQGIGYTQGLGISYEVDFDTFKELVNKLFKKHKLTTESTINHAEDHDSNLNPEIHDPNLDPEIINFSKTKVPKPEVPKTNKEAIIPEED